eukprot:jgi/Mesen1/7276/ME000373S06340
MTNSQEMGGRRSKSWARHVMQPLSAFLNIVSRYIGPLSLGLLLIALYAGVHTTTSHARPVTNSLQHLSSEQTDKTLLGVSMENKGPEDGFDHEVEASRMYDADVNLVRLNLHNKLDPRHDARGWMLDPLTAAAEAGLTGGSLSCLAVHLGQVLPGKVRGNHRHHHCNETFILWGAKQKFRLENPKASRGYSEVVLGPREVAVAAGPVDLAHAIVNLGDTVSYLLACQDADFDPKNPQTDYNVWGNIK